MAHSSSSFSAILPFIMELQKIAGTIQQGVTGCSSAWSSRVQRVATASHSMA
jgi:hypothetical protein